MRRVGYNRLLFAPHHGDFIQVLVGCRHGTCYGYGIFALFTTHDAEAVCLYILTVLAQVFGLVVVFVGCSNG